MGCRTPASPNPQFPLVYCAPANRVRFSVTKFFSDADFDKWEQKLFTEGRFIMQAKHWAVMAALLLVGYLVGTKYPQFWTKLGA